MNLPRRGGSWEQHNNKMQSAYQLLPLWSVSASDQGRGTYYKGSMTLRAARAGPPKLSTKPKSLKKRSLALPRVFLQKDRNTESYTEDRYYIQKRTRVKIGFFFLSISSRKCTAPPSLVHNTMLLHGSRIHRLQIKPLLLKAATGSLLNWWGLRF